MEFQPDCLAQGLPKFIKFNMCSNLQYTPFDNIYLTHPFIHIFSCKQLWQPLQQPILSCSHTFTVRVCLQIICKLALSLVANYIKISVGSFRIGISIYSLICCNLRPTKQQIYEYFAGKPLYSLLSCSHTYNLNVILNQGSVSSLVLSNRFILLSI